MQLWESLVHLTALTAVQARGDARGRQASFRRLLLAGVALISFSAGALAGMENYEFRLLTGPVKHGDEVSISVELVEKATGKPVPDAVIFARRVDMAPDGMAGMTADLETIASEQPGVYQFKTSLAMAGTWQLSLAAKVQGEQGTLQSKLLLKASE